MPEFGSRSYGAWLIAVYVPRLIRESIRAGYALFRMRGPWIGHLHKLVSSLWWLISTSKDTPGPDRATYARRNRFCGKCPLFNRQRGTCGTAGRTFFNPRTNEYEALGCFCVTRVKNASPANCWAFNATNGDAGWPKELNSFPL